MCIMRAVFYQIGSLDSAWSHDEAQFDRFESEREKIIFLCIKHTWLSNLKKNEV